MTAFTRAESAHYTPADPAEIPNHHTDVVCPFNPAAVCRHCGDTLHQHIWRESQSKDLHDYWCRALRSPAHFDPVDDTDLGCTHATACTVCDVRICSEHSDGFTSCHDGVHHLDSCAALCGDCTSTPRNQGDL